MTSVTKGGRDHSVTSFDAIATISRQQNVSRDLPKLVYMYTYVNIYIEAGQSVASSYVSGRVTFRPCSRVLYLSDCSIHHRLPDSHQITFSWYMHIITASGA